MGGKALQPLCSLGVEVVRRTVMRNVNRVHACQQPSVLSEPPWRLRVPQIGVAGAEPAARSAPMRHEKHDARTICIRPVPTIYASKAISQRAFLAHAETGVDVARGPAP